MYMMHMAYMYVCMCLYISSLTPLLHMYAFVGRSTMACFNTARVTVTRCKLTNACVHGVCVRGDAQVSLSHCTIKGAGTRAAFVYQRGSLELEDCEVLNTGNCHTPAIQAESIASTDDAKLVMRKCIVRYNDGPSLVINGSVEHVLEDNDFDGNVEINPDVTDATVPRPWTELETEMSAKS
jgi:hypothetical protein